MHGSNNTPLVSVVVPTFNRAAFVFDAILSVERQTYRPLEILVVDDGSSDGSHCGLLKWALEGRIRYFRHPTPRGAASARNTGIAHARGELIAFLDSDDVYEPSKIDASVMLLMRQPELIFVHGSWIEKNLIVRRSRRVDATMKCDARHEMLMFGRIATPTVVARARHVVAVGGFDELLSLVEDYDLWCRLSGLGPVGVVPEPLTTVQIHGANTPRDPELIQLNQELVIKNYFQSSNTQGLHPMSCYVANSYYWASAAFLENGKVARAVGVLLQALSMDWRHSKRRALGMVKKVVIAVLSKGYNAVLDQIRN